MRCPTFSWAGIPGASGYEIAVFRIDAKADAEPVLVTRATVAGDARAWTPGGGDCLERGQRYAWSVAAAGGDRAPRREGRTERRDGSVEGGGTASAAELGWSPALLFEVESAPSRDELERAVATLERYLDSDEGRRAIAPETPVAPLAAKGIRHDGEKEPRTRVAVADASRDERAPLDAGPYRERVRPARFAPGAPSDILRVESAGYSPDLGNASLTVSDQIHLDAASDVFKDGVLFLWNDSTGNTALGREALANLNDEDAQDNTALGSSALRANTSGFRNTATGTYALFSNQTGSFNTASGALALFANTTGSYNTASGVSALFANTTGYGNTAVGGKALFVNIGGSRNTATGYAALLFNSTGSGNTSSGYGALDSNTTGSLNTAAGYQALAASASTNFNTAIGSRALLSSTGANNTALGSGAGFYNTTGSNSIFIGNAGDGTGADNATIKIGTQGTQGTAFIAGVRGVTTTAVDAIPVLISSTGQLGTVSSSRALKRDIQDVSAFGDRLLELRPVAFRFEQHVESDPDTPIEFGLIAEEVAEVFPELVVYDQEGKPQTVKYHLLSALLLGELKEQHSALEQQGVEHRAALEQQRNEHRAELERLAARLAALESRSRAGHESDAGRGRR